MYYCREAEDGSTTCSLCGFANFKRFKHCAICGDELAPTKTNKPTAQPASADADAKTELISLRQRRAWYVCPTRH
jgi:hypothetical protein